MRCEEERSWVTFRPMLLEVATRGLRMPLKHGSCSARNYLQYQKCIYIYISTYCSYGYLLQSVKQYSFLRFSRVTVLRLDTIISPKVLDQKYWKVRSSIFEALKMMSRQGRECRALQRRHLPQFAPRLSPRPWLKLLNLPYSGVSHFYASSISMST